MCPFLLLMGAFFVGMGVGIKKFADHIYEEIIPYTDCESIDHPGRKQFILLQISDTKQKHLLLRLS